jgi:DNA-binding transcriptional MocR family regulator
LTNRRPYHKGQRTKGRYVALQEYMLNSIAWQSLDANCRALYVELARRYRGPNSNNGKIPFSVREAAKVLHISRSTAQRCFERLTETGFLRISKRSGFNMKGRTATEWLLTEFADDTTATTAVATQDFMRWSPVENSNNSPATGTLSPASGPQVALRRDRVA